MVGVDYETERITVVITLQFPKKKELNYYKAKDSS